MTLALKKGTAEESLLETSRIAFLALPSKPSFLPSSKSL